MARPRAPARSVGPPQSINSDDLDLGVSHADRVADPLAEQRAGQRRHMRERAAGRVGLVLANDAERLPAAVVALDAHGRAEMDLCRVGAGRDDLRTGAPSIPIT